MSFDGLGKFKVDEFATHHKAQILFPKSPEPLPVVHKKLNSQPSPEIQQPYPDLDFMKTRGRIKTKATMLVAKITE